MKKTAALLLALLLAAGMLLLFNGCGKRQYTVPDLSAFLDDEGFVFGMTQSEFIAKAEKIEGKEVEGSHYDTTSGGGWIGNGENALYEYFFRDERERDVGGAVFSCTVSATSKTKGLKMPAGISFSDTLAAVLKKLSIEGDPINDFKPDPDDPDGADVMTLYSKRGKKLKLSDLRPAEGDSEEETSEESGFALELEFYDVFTAKVTGGRQRTVQRTIRLSFADENSALGKIAICVRETYSSPGGIFYLSAFGRLTNAGARAIIHINSLRRSREAVKNGN